MIKYLRCGEVRREVPSKMVMREEGISDMLLF